MISFDQKIKTLLQSELDLSGDQIEKLAALDLSINRLQPLLENNCMIGQTLFMQGTQLTALVEFAESSYFAEAVAQNSTIEFGTDDNQHWFAHDVPFFGRVQITKFEEGGLTEWDIHFNECWQGPFDSKAECIKRLEDCIAEQYLEQEAEKETL